MLDIKLLRTQLEPMVKGLTTRGFEFETQRFQLLEEKRKHWQMQTQHLQEQRNQISKSVGLAKSKGEDTQALLASVNDFGDKLKQAEEMLRQIQTELEQLLACIPNVPHESVPIGQSEEDNVDIRQWGSVPSFAFPVKDHVELGVAKNWIDFDIASKISGSRFVVLKGELARLHRALTQFMLDIHTSEHGYQENYVPYIVNADSLYGTGQLPKLEEDLFAIKGDNKFYLIPTAEVSLTNLVRDTILEETALPLQFCAHTPCFRSEAGSYGKDTKGLIRQHQFEKVELVWIAHPTQSFEILEKLTGHAESILKRLNLPYRVLSLCTADLGFASAKTYDLEVWLPGQNKYREISSCSNMTDFQARRMQTRWRDRDNKTSLVHTLNGSGLAVGRTLVAIMENYQDSEGNITVPEALVPYMGGKNKLS